MLRSINLISHALTLIIILLVFWDSSYLNSLIILTICSYLFFLSLGILFLKLSYFTPNINSVSTNEVLLTFDDGPDSTTTPLILDILKKHNVKAIFFAIGSKVENNKDIVRRIINEGHLVGNHSYHHQTFFAFLKTEKVIAEIAQVDNLLAECTDEPIRYFRPPIGYTNPKIKRGIDASNKIIVGWSFRSYDSLFRTKEKFTERVLKGTKPGRIMLLHDNLPLTADMLDDYITKAKNRGIEFVNSFENREQL